MIAVQPDRFLTNKKILIAYESRPVCTIVVNFCKEKGSNTILYGNCEEMIVQAENFEPHLVFCELSMSPMDGVAFSNFIRTKFKAPIPIIMLARHYDPDKLAESKVPGPLQTLKIPFSLNEVTTAAKKAMDPVAGNTSTGLRFGPRPR
jgi:DNA-binding NtrC family response regulator